MPLGAGRVLFHVGAAATVAQQHAHAGLVSRLQEAGPDYRNDIDLRRIQSFRVLGDTGRGVLKRGSDHTDIKAVPVNPRHGIRRKLSAAVRPMTLYYGASLI